MDIKNKDSLSRKEELSTLFNEYHMLRDEMKLYLGFLRRDTGIIIGVIGAAFISIKYAAKEGLELENLEIFIPTIIFIYLLTQLINLHMIAVEAKACSKIETKINKLFGTKKLLTWESEVAQKAIRQLNTVTTLSTIGLIIVSVSFFLYFSCSIVGKAPVFINFIHGIQTFIIGYLFYKLFKYERAKN